MYVHAKDWAAAERVAAMSEDQNSLQDILIGQASQAFINKEYQKAEAFLLRAEKPEIAVDLYKEAGKIGDALRVAKEYAPSLAADLQFRLLILHFSVWRKVTHFLAIVPLFGA